MSSLSVNESRYLSYVQGELPGRSTKASIEELASTVAALQKKIDDGSAFLIGQAVIGEDVPEKARKQLEKLLAAKKLGAAIISGGKTCIDDIARIRIDDKTVLVDASVYGSILEEKVDIRDSHVSNSRIVTSTISGGSVIGDSTLEYCRLHNVNMGHATLKFVDGALDGERLTGKITNRALSVVGGTVHIQENL